MRRRPLHHSTCTLPPRQATRAQAQPCTVQPRESLSPRGWRPPDLAFDMRSFVSFENGPSGRPSLASDMLRFVSSDNGPCERPRLDSDMRRFVSSDSRRPVLASDMRRFVSSDSRRPSRASDMRRRVSSDTGRLDARASGVTAGPEGGGGSVLTFQSPSAPGLGKGAASGGCVRRRPRLLRRSKFVGRAWPGRLSGSSPHASA